MKEYEAEFLIEPKNAKLITLEEIQNKYQYATMEKGVSGLEKYFDYYITDEWVEVEKKGRNIDQRDDRYYLAVKTIRLDKEGKPMNQKGIVSLNKLVHPIPVYKEVNGSYIIEYVQQFRGIPNYKSEPLSPMEYIQKYLAGKCLKSSEETFLCAVPEFIERRPEFFTATGEKVKEREVCYFDVEEIDITALLADH